MSKLNARIAAVTVPSFTNAAKDIQSAQQAYDKVATKASVKFANATAIAFQQFIDTCYTAGVPKDKAGCNRLGKEITTNETVLNMIAVGLLQKNTITNYAQSAKRAFHFNVPFEITLFKDENLILPWSGAASDEDKTDANKTAGKSGAVEVTTREALMETLSKAIKQAALLNLTSLHDELLDLADDNGLAEALV